MDRVRIGFVGCGYMGQLAHIANYAQLPDVELAALAEGRAKTASAVAQRYGIKAVYPDHKAMLAQAKLDAVVSIMGFHLHHIITRDILDTGLPLLTEKPICIRADTGRGFLKQLARTGSFYHVGYMKRADPASRLMKKTIAEWKASGEAGKLNYLRVTMPPGDWTFHMENAIHMGDGADYGVPGEQPPAWMSKDQGNAYIGFVNYYIHQVNLIRYLLGEDYEVTFAEKTGKLLVARSQSGVPIVLEMATYTIAEDWHEYYEAHFDRGRISLDLPAPLARQRVGQLEIYRNRDGDSSVVRPVLPPLWSMFEQARIFVEEVKAGKGYLSPAEDAVKDLEVAESYIRMFYT